MNSIYVSDYILIKQETIPKDFFILFIFVYTFLLLVINTYNRIAASFLFFCFLIFLSIYFPLNGPDKGSYQEIFGHLKSFSDVFQYFNTVDSPVYYFFNILTQKIGINTYLFFAIQNILITISLAYIAIKLRNGIYISLSLFFTHLLVPFSTRIHLLTLLCIFIFISYKNITRYFASILLFGIHPMGSILPLLVFNSEDIRFKIKLKNIIIFFVIFSTALWGYDFLYFKFEQYVYNSSVYTNESSGLGISFVINIYLAVVCYLTLGNYLKGIDKIVILLPPFLSLLTVFSPMFNRFLFPSDLMIVLLFLKYQKEPKLLFLIIWILLSSLRFYKNFLGNGDYIL
ncbi:hypothetical protein GPY51_07100 [Photorhabdus laumondii subsp. laumondii]|uniref:Wzy protein n=2 Tax=Photorhabdus laumondii subsp. laumondii TaxID=141679 RepID=Q7MY71_PHOLL|nr:MULTISPECIES: Wzy protein [Photorhabdus]AWK44314.1 hypothetical protein A4R40_23960 [Photorhabdus laumondii subsp. laumondii]AXG45045.1 hypothetical protein PluDJC_24235 [Photorhabdus laumondii subsp. laumondii]AXG49628.1 hypothetical protein PluTT01m_24730 [Photorhabdus laumondii subsp. laumondii]MCZ1248763.1 hypothetical protein [Photorhabdus laumondii subsp. laumondii]NDK94704.1 hypothetical protein [Photorhabdus laumondii subsp. laumondii]